MERIVQMERVQILNGAYAKETGGVAPIKPDTPLA